MSCNAERSAFFQYPLTCKEAEDGIADPSHVLLLLDIHRATLYGFRCCCHPGFHVSTLDARGGHAILFPMNAWNPELYLRFEQQRTRPAWDLVDRIAIETPSRIADLGCGPGNSTEMVKTRWPKAAVTGVDSSAEMLEQAREKHPDWQWKQADVGTWQAEEPVDVLFSNACFQWVPGHAALMPHLMASVASGGALGMQLPYHFESPLHQAIMRLARQPEWEATLAEARGQLVVESPVFYYKALAPLSRVVDTWITHYYHPLPGPEDVLNWIRSTGLRPFLAALPDDAARAKFEALLLEAIREAYPPLVDGKIHFIFPRLFVVAYKS